MDYINLVTNIITLFVLVVAWFDFREYREGVERELDLMKNAWWRSPAQDTTRTPRLSPSSSWASEQTRAVLEAQMGPAREEPLPDDTENLPGPGRPEGL